MAGFRCRAGSAAASRSLPQVEGQWKAESTANLILTYLLVDMKDPVVGGKRGLALRQALAYGCDWQAVIDAAAERNRPAADRPRPAGRASWRSPGALRLRPGEGEGAGRVGAGDAVARLSGRPGGGRGNPIGQEQAAAARILTESYARKTASPSRRER